MNLFESIADRRINAARAAGLFDDLPGAGKPIPDLDQERPPGWWAVRLVRRERSMLAAEELDDAIRAAMPRLWRSPSEADLLAALDPLNAQIDSYNRITTWTTRPHLDPVEMVERWRALRPA